MDDVRPTELHLGEVGIIARMQKFERNLFSLATVLRDRHVLSDEDVKRMRAEYQVFPGLDQT